MGDENRVEKIENVGLNFWVQFSSSNHPHTPPPHGNHRKTLDGWQKLRQKIKNSGLTFLAQFLSPTLPPPYQSSQDPQWVTKIAPKKSKMSVWLFWPQFLHARAPPNAIIAEPSMGDENCAKKIENVGLIFSATIFITPPPLTQSPQDPRIRTIESSNIFGNLLMAISNSRVRRFRWGEGDENRGWKNWKCLQDVEKMFKVWTKQITRPSRQTSSRSA